MSYPKKILFFCATLAIVGLIVLPTLAAPTSIINRVTNVGSAAEYQNVTTNSLPQTVGQIIKVFLSLLGVIFMVYIVYAGWLWLSAAGNEDKISKAKAVIRGSIIGLIIVMSAYIITATVVDRFSQAGGQAIIQTNR